MYVSAPTTSSAYIVFLVHDWHHLLGTLAPEDQQRQEAILMEAILMLCSSMITRVLSCMLEFLAFQHGG
jgi:hypothetical protein